jgi:site-specific recombinase XerD
MGFSGRYRCRSLPLVSVGYRFPAHCHKLGECQEWTLHKFRRTYCTTLLRSGLDLRTVQAYMGHADLASTMRYLRPASSAEAQTRINAIQW